MSRIQDTIVPVFAAFGIEPPSLLPHPSEDEIVRESLDHHEGRLRDLIARTNPQRIITLGNAALRVVHAIAGAANTIPRRLSSDPHKYGIPFLVPSASGKRTELLPLAHPASPPEYQLAHAGWIESQRPTT